jgi:hypothetical protein
LFVKKVGKTVVYLVVYVDDLFITGNNENYIASIKKELKKDFKMTVWDIFTTIWASK